MCVALLAAAAPALAQAPTPPPEGRAPALYRQLRAVGLDPARVYRVRDVSIDRRALHVTFADGMIAFTKTIEGRVTGAFFAGEGEVLVSPPTRVDRASLALFTGAAILEQKFTSAYLRFNDDTFEQLLPDMRTAENPQEFIQKWDTVAQNLADADALRLLDTLTAERSADASDDRTLHVRVGGTAFGTFDLYFDGRLPEDVWVGQVAQSDAGVFYDLWTSFASGPGQRLNRRGAAPDPAAGPEEPLRVSKYVIRARVQPPHELEGDARLTVEAPRSGRRMFAFELSRFLQVTTATVRYPGSTVEEPAEIIQNEALKGTQLERRGNDLIAVVLPRAAPAGAAMQLRFRYSGAVMSEAGSGLLYVGARGIWYPNRGFQMADYDLEFRYPQNWTLVATGKRMSQETVEGEQVARYATEHPIPVAGFNLGQYERAQAKAGEVGVTTYVTQTVERSAAARASGPQAPLLPPPPRNPRLPQPVPLPETPPDPSRQAQNVADSAARTVDWLSRRLGPFPYSSLSLTQLPGAVSQGWPGLVFLSSYVFLTREERMHRSLGDFGTIMYEQLMPAHEIGHQWFGDQIGWRTYRDQWLSEALANYAALLMIEQQNPAAFRNVMEHYRQNLLRKDTGRENREAGPVTLGARLSSSKFPDGYETVTYGRGTWLLHMLREMLRDTAAERPRRGPRGARVEQRVDGDEPFFRAMRSLVTDFRYKTISNEDVQKALEAVLPEPAQYEGRKSLDWFFQGWVEGAAIPRFEVDDVKFTPRGESTVVTGKLLQKEAPEWLITSVPIYAAAAGSGKPTYLGRVFADAGETSFRFTAPAGARKLLIDPEKTVLSRP